MAEWAIVDSSPLIFLSKADSLDFLRLAASEVQNQRLKCVVRDIRTLRSLGTEGG